MTVSRRIALLIAILVLPVLLTSCGSKPEQEWKPKRARPHVKVEKKTGETGVSESELQARIVPERLKRNPFLSYLVVEKERRRSSRKIRSPLECCAVEVFDVMAVVVGTDRAYALVMAPDGKRYIVRRGDVLGSEGGRVVRIDSGGIIVRIYERDRSGRIVSSSKVRLKLRKSDEDALAR